jgi:hypothetical protein
MTSVALSNVTWCISTRSGMRYENSRDKQDKGTQQGHRMQVRYTSVSGENDGGKKLLTLKTTKQAIKESLTPKVISHTG